jgi:hypothetical protein
MKRLFLPRLRGFRVIDWNKDRRTPELEAAYRKTFAKQDLAKKPELSALIQRQAG